VAITAVEAFFARPLTAEIIDEAFGQVSMPGRFEVMGHQPLVIIDGAHNPAGADVCASVFLEDFDPAGRRLLVIGCLKGRDPFDMLSALRADEFDVVICCTAPSPRGLPAQEVADEVATVNTVEAAIDRAMQEIGPDDALLITGSLYVVGSARPYLRRLLP
jgi:dihydrofolate synthase/folylpolyglutamate synthase